MRRVTQKRYAFKHIHSLACVCACASTHGHACGQRVQMCTHLHLYWEREPWRETERERERRRERERHRERERDHPHWSQVLIFTVTLANWTFLFCTSSTNFTFVCTYAWSTVVNDTREVKRTYETRRVGFRWRVRERVWCWSRSENVGKYQNGTSYTRVRARHNSDARAPLWVSFSKGFWAKNVLSPSGFSTFCGSWEQFLELSMASVSLPFS